MGSEAATQMLEVCGAHESRAARSLLLADLAAFLDATALTSRQQRFLHRALDGLRVQCHDDDAVLMCLDLPWAVGDSLGAPPEARRPLCVITSLLYLGIDLLDDLADGDALPPWHNAAPAQPQLAAATYIAALPALAIAQLPIPLAHRAALHHTVARGLLQMSAGQQQDLERTGSARVGAAEVEASVMAKSGAEAAMFATLAAQLLAPATPEAVTPCAAFGRALGTAGQLASDCHDLFQTPQSRDLTQGTRTWPVAAYLESLPVSAREEWLRLLEQARTDAALHEPIRARLHAWGALRRCALLIELWCQRARQAVHAGASAFTTTASLRALINQVTFFPESQQDL